MRGRAPGTASGVAIESYRPLKLTLDTLAFLQLRSNGHSAFFVDLPLGAMSSAPQTCAIPQLCSCAAGQLQAEDTQDAQDSEDTHKSTNALGCCGGDLDTARRYTYKI